MKNTLNIQLHPTSLLLGLAVGVLALVAMGQKPQDVRELVRVEYGPHPRDIVVITETAPYTVPPGRLLVVTGLGTSIDTGVGGGAHLIVNGSIEATNSNNSHPSMFPLPSPGIAIKAGATVTVDDNYAPLSTGRAWGYLADA